MPIRIMNSVEAIAVTAVLVSITGFAGVAQATDFHVAKTGNDANDGSQGKPLLTI